jgi:hypothetical protein
VHRTIVAEESDVFTVWWQNGSKRRERYKRKHKRDKRFKRDAREKTREKRDSRDNQCTVVAEECNVFAVW